MINSTLFNSLNENERIMGNMVKIITIKLDEISDDIYDIIAVDLPNNSVKSHKERGHVAFQNNPKGFRK